MPYGHASMLLLGEGSEATESYNNTIKFDRIPFDPCNSIKRFDLCPFDQKISTYLQPPMGTTLEEDECLISLDVKSLYTNVPVDEAIELATKLACDGLEPPPFNRALFQKFLHLALTNVLFKCCGRRYR